LWLKSISLRLRLEADQHPLLFLILHAVAACSLRRFCWRIEQQIGEGGFALANVRERLDLELGRCPNGSVHGALKTRTSIAGGSVIGTNQACVDIARRLRDEGLEMSPCCWSLPTEVRWRPELEKALGSCKAVVIFQSPRMVTEDRF
jgi:hypothetical protein